MFNFKLSSLVFSYVYFNVTKCVEFECLKKDNVVKCINNLVCNNTYKIVLLDVLPYSLYPLDAPDGSIAKCCGECFKLSYGEGNSPRSVKNISTELMKSAKLIFPILAKAKYNMYNEDFYFLPILPHSGFTYVTEIKMSSFQLAIKSCLDMYPLFIICLMMSVLFGFVVWMFETVHNKEEYPRYFPVGWSKGIWWSMVTMVSTGPESSPKSFIVRILACIWLIVAVVMIGLMSSIITAAMVKPFPTPTMQGKKVGMLRFDKYSQVTILKNNGDLKTIQGTTLEAELNALFAALRKRELDGILIDSYTLRYYLYASDTVQPQQTFPYLYTDLMNDMTMAYGLLISDKLMYDYMKKIFAQKDIDSEIKLLKFMKHTGSVNRRTALTEPLVFTIDEPYIKNGLIYLGIMVGIACFIGLIYEVVRRKSSCCIASSSRVNCKKREEAC